MSGSVTTLKLPPIRAHGATFGLALVFLGLMLAACELLARTGIAKALRGPGSLGSTHDEFEIAMSRLGAFVAQQGRVDCLFVGSSGVHAAVIPAVLAATYQKQAGRLIHCFNAGIEGIAASTTGLLAEILVHRYHPALLIFGVTAHDLRDAGGWKGVVAIERSPWVRYHSGTFTVAGWLSEHSYAYRAYEAHRRWMAADYWSVLKKRQAKEKETFIDGFSPARRRAGLSNSIPLAKQQLPVVPIDADWTIPDAALQGLDRIARLTQEGVAVLLVEVPVSQPALQFYRDGALDHERIMLQLDRYATEHAIPLWRTMHLNLIPDGGWSDIGHMNVAGASIFSEWLGTRLGTAISRRELTAHPSEKATVPQQR